MSADRPDFAALIGSRICHDLISPLGAIGNGVELLQMGPGGKSPEVALIADSVAHAGARIRMFRLAFGSSGEEARVARGEVTGILSDMTRGGRVAVDFDGPTDLSRREVKMAFLALMCLETALAFGGKVRVERADRWTLTGEGRRLKIDPALWQLLVGPVETAELAPAHVHFALLADEAQRNGRRLAVEVGETAVRIAF
jgi:histidine phosphotransferase ChpT